MNQNHDGMEVYERGWRRGSAVVRKRVLAGAALLACMAATFQVGGEMARWRNRRIDSLADAYMADECDTTDTQTKAIVAMHREGGAIREKLRAMTASPRKEVSQNAKLAIDDLFR